MFNSNRWSTYVLFGALAACSGYTYAEEAAPLGAVRMSVMTMLQSETKIALLEQMARERKATGQQPIASSGASAVHQAPISMQPIEKPKDEPEVIKPKVSTAEVMGIWGLGDRLLADVRIDGKTLRFQRGSRYPQGYGSNSPYTLVSIQTPCVTYLEKGVARKLCIDNSN